jgi:quinoprotein glucose dehydrogenase
MLFDWNGNHRAPVYAVKSLPGVSRKVLLNHRLAFAATSLNAIYDKLICPLREFQKVVNQPRCCLLDWWCQDLFAMAHFPILSFMLFHFILSMKPQHLNCFLNIQGGHLRGFPAVRPVGKGRVGLVFRRFRFGLIRWFVSVCLSAPLPAMQAQQSDAWSEPKPSQLVPELAPASDEGELALKQFRISPQLKGELFAAEPEVANIVAFSRDYQGRFFVCETFRQQKNEGVQDNRDHPYWLDDDLRAQTIQDRIDYIRKHIPDADELYTARDDRIRLLLDRNGDGKADHSQVFADQFNRLEMGTGADVLAYRDQVFYTCIPDLFRLQDTTGDGVADQREVLQTGYGVRFAFRGHDLHGLVIGPDRRLYFSIGDRGYNVSPEVVDPASGAVFRCELDGSDLQVFSTGLRNPQNLAFDDLGNLFTCDNNSDSGDQARWLYLVPGADYGWRMYYQYLPDRGPYNREKIWHPYHSETYSETAAYIIPPIANISDGPSGLDYYPGTGFGEDFLGTFFLCDFRGTSFNSGVRSIRNQPEGAFWKIADQGTPIWGVLATDLQFASDGKLYVSDWVNGWYGENKGRIYAFYDPRHLSTDIVGEVEQLLREGMGQLTVESLYDLLGHRDRRIRQEAQFELVDRQQWETLQLAAVEHPEQLGRVHSIWGLEQLIRRDQKLASKQTAGQLARDPDSLWKLVEGLLNDEDLEIRAQSCQLGVYFPGSARPRLIQLLKDSQPRVRYCAAISLAQIADQSCVPPIVELLVENRDRDPILRHGGVMLLTHWLSQSGSIAAGPGLDLPADLPNFKAALDSLTTHADPSVRLALTVALRKRLSRPGDKIESLRSDWESQLATLLFDQDPRVSLEAARAVYDLPVPALLPRLAEVPLTAGENARSNVPSQQSALMGRVVYANLRTGGVKNAERLGELAVAAGLPVTDRLQALSALIKWSATIDKDPLHGDWWPLPVEGRISQWPRRVLVDRFAELLIAEPEISQLALQGVGKLEAGELQEILAEWVISSETSTTQRVLALQSLSQVKAELLGEVLTALKDQATGSVEFPKELLVELATLSGQMNEAEGLQVLAGLIDQPGIPLAIKQQSLRAIGQFKTEATGNWLLDRIQQLSENRTSPDSGSSIPAELQLDYLLAARARPESALRQSAERYLNSLRADDDPSARFRVALFGGDFLRGKQVFETKTEVSCVRCHRMDPHESAVGPYLGDIGLKRERQHLLDSIVQPNKEISEGFGQIKVQMLDGLLQTGLLVEENQQELKLLDADGNYLTISKEDIDAIQPGLSSMPLDLIDNLSLAELRDLLEYLAGQKGK